MTWLRRRARRGAACALFAMALQIVGTFGHVHRPDTTGFPLFKSVAIAKAPLAPLVLASDDGSSDAGVLPSGGEGDAACPLCLLGNLVASAVVASPPALALPLAYARSDRPWPVAADSRFDSRTSFWSRGPPLS